MNGAGRVTRTPDLLITNEMLYQLSYAGPERAASIFKSSVFHNRNRRLAIQADFLRIRG